MTRYLVDRLPAGAEDVFERGERGVATLEAPAVTVGETLWTAVNKERVAREPVDATPEGVLDGLIRSGPVRMVHQELEDIVLSGDLIQQHSLHDALLIGSHRARNTEAVV
ncbi:MAG: hypothetical protein ABEI99_11865, partial [Halobaculum sp.]